MTTSAFEYLQIRTPEAIEFRIPLAGPVTRMLALFIDLCAISVITGTLQKVLGPFLKADSIAGLLMLMGFVISVGYGMACELWWRGQTVGKKIMRLRVVDMEGRRLEPSQIVLRNLLRFVDQLPAFYLVGGLVCLASSKRQRLGDIAARTVVIRHEDPFTPDLEQVLGGKYNSFLEHRRLSAKLRDRVSPALAGVALEAMLRREELEPQSRVALFSELAARFRAEVEFPAELTEQLSDEQYVRNVIEVLYRAPKA